MFNGTFDMKITADGRIALPKKIREELGGKKLVLSVGFEKCIFGFSEKDWEKNTQPELERPIFSDKQARDLRRKIFSGAQNAELDGQGRFVIPERMTNYASIGEENVLVLGAGDHFEIWSKQLWETYRQGI